MTRRHHITWVAVALGAGLALAEPGRLSAQRGLKDIPDPDPARQLATLRPADGFEVNLFAAEPQISKPIHMNFDAAGRLWVVGSPLYPQIQPGQRAGDSVYILEDTNGDGTADRSTVFAENLLIPTGIEPDDTVPHLAAYVANSTELLYLEDTTGDGVADRSTVVLSGFGTEDTHHLIHTFRWGPSGHLYFTQSIYIHSHVETPWGVERLLGGGVWKFHPDTLRLEVFTRGGVNMWGHHVDRYGQSFMTDGAFGEGITYAFPGAAYEAAVGAERLLKGLNPGQPKQSGLEIVSGRHLPERWRDRLVTNDFRGNRVNSFQLEDSGSGYVSRQTEDLLTSTHVAFRPVDVKMGPDGAIYIADWYNPIIQHGEVDFRDPRRDTAHGRIWRVTATGRPLVDMLDLERASVPALLEALASPEGFTRERAKPLLKRHGADAVLPALRAWVADLDRNNPDEARLFLEALWVAQWLNAPQPDLLETALGVEDFRVRAGAVRVASDWAEQLEDPSEIFARAVNDAHPRVRLEAVNALRLLDTAEAAQFAARAADHPLDTNLDYALWLTLRELADRWLPRVAADPTFFGDDPGRLMIALRSAGRPEAAAPILRLWQAGTIPPEHRLRALELVGDLGGPAELGTLFDLALAPATSAEDRAGMLGALRRAAADRKVTPEGPRTRLLDLLRSPDPDVRAATVRLAGAWQLDDARPAIVEAAHATEPALRTAALDALVDLGPSSRDTLLQLSTSGLDDRRLEAVAALARLDVSAAAPLAVRWLDAQAVDPARVVAPILAQKEGPAALADALAKATLSQATGRALLRAVSATGRELPDLARAIEGAARLEPVTAMPTGEALRTLIETVEREGDPARGERVYRRPELLCVNCHGIAGAGGQVGPDLASIGASAPLDYIIQAVLNPQATVKEGYHITSIVRHDGSVTAGVLLRETSTELVLRDALDVEHRVPAGQVQSRSISPVSLMPPGLTAQIRDDETVDLFAFLSRLGRGDYAVPNVPYIRRYELMEAGSAISATIRERGIGAVARDTGTFTWHAVYANVDGSLPTADLPAGTPDISYFAGQQFRAARFALDVLRAGNVSLAFDDPAGLELYIGERKIDPVTAQTTFDLPEGTHTLTVIVNRTVRGPDTRLRIHLADPPANPAQVQAVAGK
jgi:putative heme-binding domain-containing protein